jgi:steroid 5-alpha reductase family enzyme
MIPVICTALGVVGIFVTLLFFLSLIIKRNDIADIAWGTGIIIVGLVGYMLRSVHATTTSIVLLLVVAWGVRLTLRIFLRNIKKGEDARYRVWRETWGQWFYLRSYFQVYLLQGLLMIVVGYPLLHLSVFARPGISLPFVFAGSLVWALGFFFEGVGDCQLDTFIASKPPKDAVLSTGLWRYTRHPNYFGEVTQWWGIFVIMLSIPHGIFTIVSPLMITFLILKVSGIPMLEKRFEGNPNFEAYKKTTNAFFPWFPKG